MRDGVISIVVPCFNESERLRVDDLATWMRQHPDYRFWFVNDGSKDATLDVLHALQDRVGHDQARVLDLPKNQGKAEAVRQGMLAAMDEPDCQITGYFDADLATPLEELPNLARELQDRPDTLISMGSRVLLLGRQVQRKRVRHYIGRIFATLASMTLNLSVYDTQCGAKLFRAQDSVRQLFAKPFLSRWIFDVEILARFVASQRRAGHANPASRLVESPLRQWIDVDGSKVKPSDTIRAAWELWRIRRQFVALQREPQPAVLGDVLQPEGTGLAAA